MSKRRDRHARKEMRRLAAKLYGQPLLIAQEKLEILIDVFEDYRAGLRMTTEQRQRLLAGGLGVYSDEFDDEDEDDGEQCSYQIVNGVAVLSLSGTITQRPTLFQKYSGGTSCEVFQMAFDKALADSRVSAIVVNCDTFGGEICGVDELSRHVFESRGQKPMQAIANSHMHSAGYYIGSAFDQVIVKPTGMVGSVGVVSAHQEQSKAEAEWGVKYTLIHAGKHKVDGNQHEPLSTQGRKSIQEVVDDAYKMFTEAVARNRGISVDQVIKEYGEGKSFLGQSAVDVGLADAVATLEETIAELSASGQRAAASARIPKRLPVKSQSAQHENHAGKPKEESNVHPKIKAALFARSLIASLEASDAECNAALAAFCAARGVDKPDSPEATVELIGSAAPKPESSGKRLNTNGGRRLRVDDSDDSEEDGKKPGANGGEDDEDEEEDQTTATRRRNKIESAAAKRERSRLLEIQSRGRLLGISQEKIDAAVDSGKPLGDVLVEFTNQAAADQPPVLPVNGAAGGRDVSIRPGEAALDKFSTLAVEAMVDRYGGNRTKTKEQRKPLSAGAQQLRYSRAIDIATESLRLAGVRCEAMDPDERAKQFLQLGGDYSLVMGPTGYQTPSDYPNILSAVSGKILDNALEINTSTYRQWCAPLPSVPDFKPKTIVARGSRGELNRLVDGQPFPDAGKRAEEASWIATDAFGDETSLTPKMITDDDLGVFFDDSQALINSADLTLNRLCVDLLVGNPELPDGKAAFHADHGNIIDAGNGGAPSVSQSKAMRLKMRGQLDIGGKNRLRVSPSLALISSTWETEAEQVWLTPPDGIYYQADSSVNNFRNKIKPICEPMLDDWTASAGQVWFGFADPRVVRVIVYMYQIGFENAKINSYYDPKTRSRVLTVETRCAAAWRQYRGVVRNSGGNGSF